MDDTIRITANLPGAVAREMRKMAEKNKVSMTEILRRAISREKFFEEAKERNDKVILQDNKGTLKEVIFA